MKELKTFTPVIGSKFEAMNKKYTIEQNLSISRAVILNKMEIEMLNHISYDKLKADLIDIYHTLNKGQFADSAVKIHNLAYGMEKSLEVEDLPILRICTLFINEENEDRRTISEEQIVEKIKIWQESGYMIEPFFVLALSFLPSVGSDFKQRILTTLVEKQKEAAEKAVQQTISQENSSK